MDIVIQNQDGSRVGPLLQAIPAAVAGMPHVLSADAARLQAIVDDVHLRVTEGRTWRFEALSSGIVYVSDKAVELLWASAYAHAAIYRRVFAGKQISGDYDAAADPELDLPRAMLTWCLNENVMDDIGRLPDGFPAPPDAAPIETLDGFARRAGRTHLEGVTGTRLGRTPAGATESPPCRTRTCPSPGTSLPCPTPEWTGPRSTPSGASC